MSDELRPGVTVFPHVAGWDTAPTHTRPAVVLAGAVAMLDDGALTEFAAALVAGNSDLADRLINALITKLEVEPDAERHDRIAAAILAGAGALE